MLYSEPGSQSITILKTLHDIPLDRAMYIRPKRVEYGVPRNMVTAAATRMPIVALEHMR